jgi:hypothetical protein
LLIPGIIEGDSGPADCDVVASMADGSISGRATSLLETDGMTVVESNVCASSESFAPSARADGARSVEVGSAATLAGEEELISRVEEDTSCMDTAAAAAAADVES